MKRIFTIAMATVMALSLFGCGKSGTSQTTSGGSTETIKVASDGTYAPMEFMEKGKLVGFDIDFLQEVLKEAGLKYEVNNLPWDTMLDSVKQGKEYQAGISAISITDERKQTYDFSVPYFESTNMILVKEGSDIKSATDLKNKKVAVQGATTADELMSDILGKDNTNLKRFDSNAVALLEMEKGGADAVVADIAIIKEYIKNNPNKKLQSIPDTKNFQSEYYGIAYPKGSNLKAKIDPAIKKVIENGTYAKVYKKWFGEDPKLDNLKNEISNAK